MKPSRSACAGVRQGHLHRVSRALPRGGHVVAEVVACQYRAAEWRHKEVELAAHDLLQYLDKRSG